MRNLFEIVCWGFLAGVTIAVAITLSQQAVRCLP